MPMPGSQEMNSISIAYFLHEFRWLFRLVFAAMIITGAANAFSKRWKLIPVLSLLILGFAIYLFNFPMSTDSMFIQPVQLQFADASDKDINKEEQVIGITINGVSKAYPVSYLVYHHQVRDVIGNEQVMVTYCSVCRTGRIYKPVVKGKPEDFRLVGMDHFNAMFEDATTKSWWRQATGEAVAGKLTGEWLPELPSSQMTAKLWWDLHPNGLVMKPDPGFTDSYDTELRFEQGKSRSSLTGTDSLSWKKKSWVVGINTGKNSKAYDWNYLKSKRVINDKFGDQHIAIALNSDNMSYAAFIKDDSNDMKISGDTLIYKNESFDFSGKPLASGRALEHINAHQEFWHSWKTFHPQTESFPAHD